MTAFADNLPLLRAWYVDDRGMHCWLAKNTDINRLPARDDCDHLFTQQELNTVHPQLYQTLCNVQAYLQQQENVALDAVLEPYYAVVQLSYLCKPWYTLLFEAAPQPVAEFIAFHWTPGDETAVVWFTTLQLVDRLPATKTTPSAPCTPFVINTAYQHHQVSTQTLDQYYPGWQQRHAAASALELDTAARAAFIMMPTHVPNADLSGVQLD